jgi:hypothetical protein
MADTIKLTFTRPVRVNAKRFARGASAPVDEAIAVQLIECGAATVVAEKTATDKKG